MTSCNFAYLRPEQAVLGLNLEDDDDDDVVDTFLHVTCDMTSLKVISFFRLMNTNCGNCTATWTQHETIQSEAKTP